VRGEQLTVLRPLNNPRSPPLRSASPSASPGLLRVQLEAFGKPVRSTDGLCAHADGTDEPLRSTTTAFNASSAALDSFVAASVSVDNYRVDVRYKFSLGGLRGAPRAVVRANERLTVPSTQDVLEFRDELVFEAGSVMQITVRNAGAVAASSTKIKANRATVRCILTVLLDNYTPTAFQKSKAAFTVEVPAMFDIPTRNVAFDSVVTAPMIANYTPSASVSSTGALLLVFTQIGLASTTGTPSTPAPGGAVIVTPVPVVPTTTTTAATATTTAVADTTRQLTIVVTPATSDFSLFGLVGTILYVALGGAALGVLLVCGCCIVLVVVLCRRRSSKAASNYPSNFIAMQPAKTVAAYPTGAPTPLQAPPTLHRDSGLPDYAGGYAGASGTLDSDGSLPPILALDARTTSYAQPKTVVAPSVSLDMPPILALDARATSYAQPKTVVGGSDIAF
jgi:hypothetical protein